MSNLYGFFKQLTRVAASLIYKIEFDGKENIPNEGPLIIVGNHIHNFDPIIISYATKREIHYMAKSELFKNKCSSFLFKSVNCIKVDRNKNDINAIKNSLRVLKDGQILGIFPEGTRVKNESEPIEVKSGAVVIASKAKVNILPVAIAGNYRLFSKIKVKILPIYDVQVGMEKHNKNFDDVSNEIMQKIYSEARRNNNENFNSQI